MKTTNKIFRVVKVAFLFVCDIIFAVFGWLFLCFILFVCKADALYKVLLSSGVYVYAIIAFFIILRNTCHRVKWYVRTNIDHIQCTQCHAIVPLVRYKENNYLNSPISLCIPKINKLFRFVQYRVLFYEIAYRPYLQLDCPHCGEKQVVCPYCHEIIPQESIECHYDKPSVCPHCEKKIYTPIPIREWKDSIYIGDIID